MQKAKSNDKYKKVWDFRNPQSAVGNAESRKLKRNINKIWHFRNLQSALRNMEREKWNRKYEVFTIRNPHCGRGNVEE